MYMRQKDYCLLRKMGSKTVVALAFLRTSRRSHGYRLTFQAKSSISS